MAREQTAPMTITLDQMIEIVPLRCTLLSDRAVKAVQSKRWFLYWRKYPFAVLIKQVTVLNTFELEGNPMKRERVEAYDPDFQKL